MVADCVAIMYISARALCTRLLLYLAIDAVELSQSEVRCLHAELGSLTLTLLMVR